MPVRSVIIPDISRPSSAQRSINRAKPVTTTVVKHDNKRYEGTPTTGFYPKLIKLTPEQKFDYKMGTGVKLSNGATLIRPLILSLGEVIINKAEDGNYTIKSSVTDNTLTMNEKELVNTKWLSRGLIKEIGDNLYKMTYYDRDGELHTLKTDKENAMKILEENTYYM